MSNTTDADTRRYADPDRDASASDIRKKTWPHGMPALRLTRVPRRSVRTQERAADGEGGLHAHPRGLRLVRLGVGLLLLVLAWAGVMADVMLVRAVGHGTGSPRSLSRYVLAALQIIAGCWVGLAVLACIVAGAFCLTLAITGRE